MEEDGGHWYWYDNMIEGKMGMIKGKMDIIENERENTRVRIKNVNTAAAIATKVNEKELSMLFEFENKLEKIDELVKAKEIEFDKLMESHQHLASEIDRLGEFIISDIDGEPSEDESAVDAAIRLLKDDYGAKEMKK